MARKPHEIEDTLTNKFGFVEAKTHSRDHKWYELQLEDLPVIATKLSHSVKEIGPKLEGKIARQLRVGGRFFDGMMSCANSKDDYDKKVRNEPYPPWEIGF